MGLEEVIKTYAINIGLKRAFAAGLGSIVGYMGSPLFAHALEMLKPFGITVIVDMPVFQKEMLLAFPVITTFVHDWVRLKFPNITWL